MSAYVEQSFQIKVAGAMRLHFSCSRKCIDNSLFNRQVWVPSYIHAFSPLHNVLNR